MMMMISVSVLTGCGRYGKAKNTEAPSETRFVTSYKEGEACDSFTVIVDSETGVNYLVRKIGGGNSNSIAMCPLLDAEGKPVITDISEVNEE